MIRNSRTQIQDFLLTPPNKLIHYFSKIQKYETHTRTKPTHRLHTQHKHNNLAQKNSEK